MWRSGPAERDHSSGERRAVCLDSGCWAIRAALGPRLPRILSFIAFALSNASGVLTVQSSVQERKSACEGNENGLFSSRALQFRGSLSRPIVAGLPVSRPIESGGRAASVRPAACASPSATDFGWMWRLVLGCSLALAIVLGSEFLSAAPPTIPREGHTKATGTKVINRRGGSVVEPAAAVFE
jgi:hypothetical protein